MVDELGDLENVRQRELRKELETEPSEEELENAIQALRSGKSGGSNGIPPELIRHMGAVFDEYVLDLFREVWRAGKVPQDWVDAVIVVIPKKGDLSLCDNWRGICLLDVFGKLFARILQQKLQRVAEEELAETQCGFRRGRGCMDMIFCTRQMVEKAIEHREQLFLVFVDLRKAYDSVPREAMWRVLEKYGFPVQMINIIRSFHEDMSAELKIGGKLLEGRVGVSSGLRQGSTMAPALFYLFFNLAVEEWRALCESDGVTILSNANGRLIGTRSYKNQASWNMLQFADDTAVFAPTLEKAVHVMSKLFEVTRRYGLTISTPKTKAMVVGGR